MTSLATDRHHTAPAELLTALRAARTGDAETMQNTLQAWSVRPLTGGRNNDVFAWAAPDGEICIKLYKKTDRRRVEREWHGLSHVAGLGSAPAPLWLDEYADQPALGMTLVPGTPILDGADPAAALKSLAEVTRAMQAVPLTEPLASLERVDSIGHYIARLTDVWPGQLADATNDPQTADMLALLRRWQESGDAETLSRPATAVYSRGDANLLNWHHDGDRTYVVDFEFSRHSDVAVDAADHIEHISARDVPDDIWNGAESDLGIDHSNRRRFDAAQRTIALRWLAVLWKQRDRRVAEFTTQHDRVRAFFS
jgi:hypothetical protein